MTDSVDRSERFTSYAIWLLLLLVLLTAAGIRLRLLSVPLERDEGEYAYAGQLILQGIPPFRLVYNMKLPGTYAAYAISMAVFGQTTQGIRLGLILVNAATALFLFLLARRWFGSVAGFAAATVFAFLSLSTEMLAIFGHATHYVILPAVAGLLVFDFALGSGRWRSFFLAGVLLGLAVLMKQPGGIFLIYAVIVLAQRRLSSVDRRLPLLLRDLAGLVFGAALPLVLTGCILAAAGVFPRFWFWIVEYGSKYATQMSLADALTLLRETTSRFLPQAPLLWGLASLGLLLLLFRSRDRSRRKELLVLLSLSFLGVCPGLYFREHYFILMLPAVSLLAGVAFHELETIVPRPGKLRETRAALLLLLTLSCAQALFTQRLVLLELRPDDVSRYIYDDNLFSESREIARVIRENTGADDRIFVFGSEPEIYFYSGRHSATGYIYMYPLMERQPFARRMQEEMAREVESAKPGYIVWVRTSTSWLQRSDSETWVFDWIGKYVVSGYEVAGQVISLDTGPVFLWGAEAAATPSGDSTQILVLRRKGRNG